MKTLKFLENLEHSFGERVWLPTPLKMTSVTKTIEPVSPTDPSVGWLMDQRIRVGTHTRMREGYTDTELQQLNLKATAMFAREIYGEVSDDLFLIMRHVHENHHDHELSQMIGTLMDKLRP